MLGTSLYTENIHDNGPRSLFDKGGRENHYHDYYHPYYYYKYYNYHK